MSPQPVARRTRRRSLLALALFGAAAGFSSLPAAEAQQVVRMAVSGSPGGGFGGRSRPAMTPRDLDSYAAILELDEPQKEAAKELLASYTSEYEKATREQSEKIRRISEEFRETRDDEVWQEMGPVSEKFNKRATELEASLMADLRMICSDKQLTQWPKMERTRRRDRTIDRGSISGESVDLVRIVHALELSEAARAELGAQLEAYEQDLDRALEARNKIIDEQAASLTFGGPMTFDMEKMQKQMQDAREAGSKVRDINQRYARAIEGLLPDAARPAFALQVKRASFPAVYRQSRTERAFDAAMKFDDLDARQKEAIGALRQSHENEIASLNDKWAAAVVKEEEEGSELGIGGGAMMISFGDDDENKPTTAARKARRDADRKALASLESLLSEAQRERLPRAGDEIIPDVTTRRGRVIVPPR